MARDFVPDPDPQFDIFVHAFAGMIDARGSSVGIDPTEITDLDGKVTNWESDYANHRTAQDAARTATATKDATRVALTGLVRSIAARVQKHPAMNNAWRAEGHLPEYDTVRTAA